MFEQTFALKAFLRGHVSASLANGALSLSEIPMLHRQIDQDGCESLAQKKHLIGQVSASRQKSAKCWTHDFSLHQSPALVWILP